MDINATAEVISERLGLVGKAQGDAQNDMPSGNGRWPIMASIIPEVQKCGESELGIISAATQNAEEAISTFEATVTQVRNQLNNLTGDLGLKDALSRAQVGENTAIAAYKTFKSENGLIRDASGDDRIEQILWAVVIVVIEGLLNCHFLAPAFNGLVEAFLAAFFVSFINVGFAFIGGALGLRYLINHRNVNKQLGGLIGFLICLSTCLLTVLLSAWFRGHVDVLKQEDIDLAEISAKAWTSSLQDMQSINLWGAISSISSFLLVFVGLLCSFLGFWKGYKYDDSYPGFGDMYRTKINASEARQEVQSEYQQRQQEQRKERNQLIGQCKDSFYHMKTAVEGLGTVVNQNSQMLGELKNLAQILLVKYYNANCTARATPAPPFPDDFPADKEFDVLQGRQKGIMNSYQGIRGKFDESERRFGSFREEYQN